MTALCQDWNYILLMLSTILRIVLQYHRSTNNWVGLLVFKPKFLATMAFLMSMTDILRVTLWSEPKDSLMRSVIAHASSELNSHLLSFSQGSAAPTWCNQHRSFQPMRFLFSRNGVGCIKSVSGFVKILEKGEQKRAPQLILLAYLIIDCVNAT